MGYDRTTIHRNSDNGKYRGAFMGLGSDDKEGKGRRMWLLKSWLKGGDPRDLLVEIDTVTGKVMQELRIEGCVDGHDAVRVGRRVFIVDTRHGDIIEIAIPPLSPPFFTSSIAAGAEIVKRQHFVNIIKRHRGHTRADHINNVAIHPNLLLTNLHGKDGMKPKVKEGSNSKTRLSALDRNLPETEGRELNLKQDGFDSVRNVGTWCHGIAFWEDTDTDQIKLISLDSKSGSIVSVVLAGVNYGHREVIWTPDLEHPILKPPDGVARAYNNGAAVFAKGLAVQAGVAYFGVTYARAPPLRQTVPECLLVSIDLKSRREIFVRTVLSNGLINQILTKSYLGDIQLSEEPSSMEVTQHDGGDGEGTLVDYCEDLDDACSDAYTDRTICQHKKDAKSVCCACKGGRRIKRPLRHGALGDEIMKLEKTPNATVTFVPHHTCLNGNGITKRIPLHMKEGKGLRSATSIQSDLDGVVRHICNVNVEPFQALLKDLGGDEGFILENQHSNGNAIIARQAVLQKFKPGCEVITLIFSSRNARKVYHFPWLYKWLPMLQDQILGPLGIPVNQIIRMQVANMPRGSDIRFHSDLNPWVKASHRFHVPIITHPDIFFLAEMINKGNSSVRIRSNAGEVYEFNNAKRHAVKNLGPSRVHLIIDWVENPIYHDETFASEVFVKLRPKEVCTHASGVNEMECNNFEMEYNTKRKKVEDGEKEEL